MTNWLLGWAWGRHSAIDIIRSAEAFKRDGHKDEFVDRLLKAAPTGKNAERAAQSILPANTCPVHRVTERIVEELILPMDMLNWVRQANPLKFMLRFGAEEVGLEWRRQGLLSTPAGRDFWAQRPYLRRRTPQVLRYSVPLALHEDAVPIWIYQCACVRS